MAGTNQVDDTARDVRLDVALVGGAAIGDGGEVAGPDNQVAPVLEEEGPFAGVEGRGDLLGLDGVVDVGAHDGGLLWFGLVCGLLGIF